MSCASIAADSMARDEMWFPARSVQVLYLSSLMVSNRYTVSLLCVVLLSSRGRSVGGED
jgi:hypothetical protein